MRRTRILLNNGMGGISHTTTNNLILRFFSSNSNSLSTIPFLSSLITQTLISHHTNHNPSSRPISSSSRSFQSQPFIQIPTHKPNHQEILQQIIEIIKKNESNMEFKLDSVHTTTFSLNLVTEIFRNLNLDKISGFRFFNWVKTRQISFYRNSDFNSLIIDNLGYIKDDKLMLLLMKEFTRDKICLTEKAFTFLPTVRDDVVKVLEMLNNVGGSCRNSGVFGLIKMLCIRNSFDLAVFVMEVTTRKVSYYNVMIWAKCRSFDFGEAYEMFDEMKEFGCDPNANSYNYLLGSLCKNSRILEACRLFEKMNEFGYVPNEVTFEVVICHACNVGRLDFAVEFIGQMMSRGIEPRYTTHAAIIKGYFYGNRFHEAYKYVKDMCTKCKYSGNMNYSLLASLLQKSRRAGEAREILVDMMDMGLKPNFPVYMKVMKDLYKSGKGYLVADLKSRYSKFDLKEKEV